MSPLRAEGAGLQGRSFSVPNSGDVDCRAGCGACCVAPSISSPIPGMPDGKPAGVRCVQLDALNRCLIFGDPSRPEVCRSLRPNLEMCGNRDDEAYLYLSQLEEATRPTAAALADKLPFDLEHCV